MHEAVAGIDVQVDAPLARPTTMQVGGPADVLVTVTSADQIARVATIARGHGVPLTVLGGGSNVLVADIGIRGVVLRMHGGEVTQVGTDLVRADAASR